MQRIDRQSLRKRHGKTGTGQHHGVETGSRVTPLPESTFRDLNSCTEYHSINTEHQPERLGYGCFPPRSATKALLVSRSEPRLCHEHVPVRIPNGVARRGRLGSIRVDAGKQNTLRVIFSATKLLFSTFKISRLLDVRCTRVS